MLELKQLIGVVEKRAPKFLQDYVDNSQESLERRLFLLIKDRKVEDDAGAIRILYGNSAEAKGYKMLKSRLKKKLYAAVDTFDLDDNTLKPYAKEEHLCLNLLSRVNILLKVGELNLAKKVATQATTIAKDIKMTSLLLRCYELQYLIYFDLDDYNSFKLCENQLKQYRKLKNIELDAQSLYLNTRFGLKQAVASRKENLEEIPGAITIIEQKWEETWSPLIYEQLHILKIQFCELKGDYKQIIDIIENAEKVTKAGVIPHKTFDRRFNKFIKLYAILHLRLYEEGLAYAQEIESDFIYGSRNWSAFMENYFLLALQSKDYDLAAGLLGRVFASGALRTINKNAVERWALFINYYNLIADNLIETDAILGEDAEVILKQNVKDKEGFNVAIIILNFFEMLKQDKLEDTSLYSDRIRKYISKHLGKKEAVRPRLFLKLLLLMLRNNLDVATCRTKGKYLLQKLRRTPLPGSAFAEVEIVPYEQLWDLALQTVEVVNRKALHS